MIRNIFIPEQIGNYYLLPKRILGFSVSNTSVNATQLYLNGKNVFVEKFFNEKLPFGQGPAHDQRISTLIKSIVSHAAPFDEVRASLSSSYVIFKELHVPILGTQKIHQIIEYEIESFIPFPLEEAVADFIITCEYPKEKSSDIMVAIAKKSIIAQYIELFTQAGVDPAVISVDMFDLYSLYKTIPNYSTEKKKIVLLDIGFIDTKFAYIEDGKLYFIRTIPKGISTIAKEFATTASIEPNIAIEHLIRFGTTQHETEDHKKALLASLNSFMQSINFTLESFKSQRNLSTPIDQILVLGESTEIQGFNEIASDYLSIEIKNFNINNLFKNKNITLQGHKGVESYNIQSLATALPTTINEKFNFRQKELQLENKSLLLKQIIATIILTCTLLIIFFAHTHIQIKKLKNAINQSKEEVITTLSKEFKIPKAYKAFNDIVSFVKRETVKDREIWFAFSAQTRSSFLKYLQGLSSAIDREGIGLQLQRLLLTNSDITMEGSVKGFDELAILEYELEKSKLFSSISTPQTTQFIIHLVLAKEEEEI